MTNVEYGKIAERIITECQKKIKDECQGKQQEYHITNISELFFLKIGEAISLKKKESSFGIVKEYNNIMEKTSEIEEDDTSIDVSAYLNQNERSQQSQDLYLFRMLQFSMEHFPDIQKVLQNIGIKDPINLIRKVKEVGAVNWEKDEELITSVIKEFKDGSKVKEDFLSLSIFYYVRDAISGLFICCFNNEDDSLFFLKTIQYIGDTYFEVYKKRMGTLFHLFDNLDEAIDMYKVIFFKKNDIDKIYHRNKNDVETLLLELDKESSHNMPPAFLLDLFFLAYHMFYFNPSLMVTFSFYLISDKVSYSFQEAMLKVLRDKDYAPIIQYEYEWYCTKIGKEAPSFMSFYSGEPVDLNSFGIADYDLNTVNKQTNTVPMNDNNKEKMSDLTENRKRNPKIMSRLPIPPIFAILRPTEQGVVLLKLYELMYNYLESTSDDFCYLLGRKKKDDYKPDSCKKINWKKGRSSLQYFINKLFKNSETDTLPKGTWVKVESVFLLNEEKISGIGENARVNITNLDEATKQEIDDFINKARYSIKRYNEI